MKLSRTLTTFGVSLLLGLFSAASIAEQTSQTPQTAAPTAVPQNASSQAMTQPKVVQSVNPNTVNINTATAAELQDKLLNIGAKKAQAIVEYREKNGGFKSIEQLTEVSGIGKATLEKNRDRIVLE